MNVTVIAAVTALAALLTGIATLLSIREMRLQRRAQHRPELVVEDTGFRAIRLDRTSDRAVVLGPLEGGLGRGDQWRGVFPVRIHNVGAGVARDVTAAWTFDKQAFVDALIPFEQDIGGTLRTHDTIIERDGRWMVSGPPQVQRLGAILPSPFGTGKVTTLDSAYTRLLNDLYIAYEARHGSFERGSQPPDLHLSLSYRDLEGRRYSKALTFSFQPMYSTRMHDDDTEDYLAVGMGYLLVAEQPG